MYQFIKKTLFLFDAEKAHKISFKAMKLLFSIPFTKQIVLSEYSQEDKSLERNVLGLTFKNPIGLAAGFDKNGVNIDELANYGFGTVWTCGMGFTPFQLNDDWNLLRPTVMDNRTLS